MKTIIPNPNKLKILEEIITKENSNLLVVADFDGTLTKEFTDGKKTPSLISILRNEHFLSESYSKKAHKMYEHYQPIEIDTNLTWKQKNTAMEERRRSHYELLIQEKLNINHIKQAIDGFFITFRDEAKEFLKNLHNKNIPIVIISASGIGSNSIELFLEANNSKHDNIYIISNKFIWDKEGNAIKVQDPIIHSLNKNTTNLNKFPFYNKIKNKKNIILLGNNTNDSNMIDGFNYKNIIKIGFLDKITENKKKAFSEAFDIIITNNGNFQYPLNLLNKYT